MDRWLESTPFHRPISLADALTFVACMRSIVDDMSEHIVGLRQHCRVCHQEECVQKCMQSIKAMKTQRKLLKSRLRKISPHVAHQRELTELVMEIEDVNDVPGGSADR